MSACCARVICRVKSWSETHWPISTAYRHRQLYLSRDGHRSVPRRCLIAPAVAEQSANECGRFTTLAAEHQVTVEVKRSKFITTAWPVSSPEQALEYVTAARDPAASHNCWAYKVGGQFRSTDDGEPSSTAGPPILNAINGEGLDGVCVLVTRIFGGTKLGAGGLIRAYGGAARECLRGAQHCTVTPKRTLRLQLEIGDIGIVYGMLDKMGGERVEEQYSADGQSVTLTVRLQQSQLGSLTAAVSDASSGRVQVHDGI